MGGSKFSFFRKKLGLSPILTGLGLSTPSKDDRYTELNFITSCDSVLMG